MSKDSKGNEVMWWLPFPFSSDTQSDNSCSMLNTVLCYVDKLNINLLSNKSKDGLERRTSRFWKTRLQNSPYFAYSSKREQSNKRCGIDCKTVGFFLKISKGFFSLASHALRACEARAVRAHKTLTPRVTDFFTDFEEKTDCFAVYWKTRGSTFADHAYASLKEYWAQYLAWCRHPFEIWITRSE